MAEHSRYIVQFVGFKTTLDETDFINRWTPFAIGFKKLGIKSIDLYKISNNEHLTFISRNIWDTQTYFQNFPTGVAGSGSGGGISVTQFGGYWIAEHDLEKPDKMQILFTNDYFPASILQRKRCTEQVNFKTQVEFAEKDSIILNSTLSNILMCTYRKTM